MSDDPALRKEVRAILATAMAALERDLKKLRRKVQPIGFAQEGGMVRTMPGGSYLVVEDLDPVDHGTGGTLGDEILTPGYLWKFQNRKWGYCEMTLTVSDRREAELTLTRNAQLRGKFAENSSRYPATREGWKQVLGTLNARH
jgi:hypothetical protein